MEFMLMKNGLFVLTLLLCLIVGCSALPNTQPPTRTDQLTRVVPLSSTPFAPSSSATALPSVTPSPNPSATVVPTATPPSMSFATHCLDVSPVPIWGGIGDLVVVTARLSRSGSVIDMQTGTGPTLLDKDYDSSGYIIQSPDRNWLAYKAKSRAEKTYVLVIQSADGLEHFTYPLNYQEWDGIVYWLDNQTLVLWHYERPRTSIILWNPFTGEKTPMGMDYPDILSDNWEWLQHSWTSVTIYAPSLRYLVYLKDNNGNILEPRMVLWDREAKRPIATIEDFGYTWVWPLWKLDESGLVYVKAMPGLRPIYDADEVYFLSIEGENTQLTQLSNHFPEATIWKYNWSPDERFLALNVRTSMNGGEHRLLVLDLSSLALTDYCLEPQDFSQLIWSPDSQQLAFTEQLPDKRLRTVVIDVVKQNAFVVADDSEPTAWLRARK